MERITQWMERYFVPFAAQLGSQKHLVAIRDSFVMIMPITMAGSIAVLFNVLLKSIPLQLGADRFVEFVQPIIQVNSNVWFGTLSVFALIFTIALGYNLSRTYAVNSVAGAVVAFSAYITSIPQTSNNIWGVIDTNYTGATGLFSALILGFVSSLIYIKVTKSRFVITMPDSVPSGVAKAFHAIIPGAVAIFSVSILTTLIQILTGDAFIVLIQNIIQKPFLNLSQGLGSVIIVTLFVHVFWFFGLHGTNVLMPLLDGVYKTALAENTTAYAMGLRGGKLPHVWTRGSFDAYAWMGGAGATLALLIAILLFSKRTSDRTIANLSLPMGVFNINEPVTFGLPIVLNSTYIIPYILITPIMVSIAYGFTIAGIIPPVALEVPWVVPPVLYAFLATGGSFAAAGVALLNLGIAVVLWSVFIKISNKYEI